MPSSPQPLPEGAPRWHLRVLVVGLTYLALAWLAMIVVQFSALEGLQARLLKEGRQPVFWLLIFGEGGPIENGQWFFLGAAAVCSAYLAGVLRGRGQRGAARFWTIMAAGLALMLIEDAGNIRHHFGSYVGLLTDAPSRTHSAAVAIERLTLWAIGCVLLFALLYRREMPWRSGPTRRLLIAGYLVYGTVATTNATRDFFSWYERTGNVVLELFAGRLGELTAVAQARGLTTGHELMDTVFEESMEFLGATLLLSAIFAYAAHVRVDASIADGDPPLRSLLAQLRGRA
jgi:hypothetical protein